MDDLRRLDQTPRGCADPTVLFLKVLAVEKEGVRACDYFLVKSAYEAEGFLGIVLCGTDGSQEGKWNRFCGVISHQFVLESVDEFVSQDEPSPGG